MLALLAVVGAGIAPATAQASDDPFFSEQWALDKIGAAAAWERTTGKGVRVGVVDSGIELTHEDLVGKVVAHTSCIGAGDDPSRCSGAGADDVGHGTAVAGIVAALKDNGKGIAGVAPDVELVVAKVADRHSGFVAADSGAGIKWAVDQGARVVNVSLGEQNPAERSPELAEAVEYAWSHGAVAVLAAGDIGGNSYNRGAMNALVVGATGPDDVVADYSSPTGDAKWALLAPGGRNGDDKSARVKVTWLSSSYGYASGTSFSAPHVSAAVALLLAQGLSPQAAVDRILATVDTTVGCGEGSPTCRGRLDVGRATGGRS